MKFDSARLGTIELMMMIDTVVSMRKDAICEWVLVIVLKDSLLEKVTESLYESLILMVFRNVESYLVTMRLKVLNSMCKLK